MGKPLRNHSNIALNTIYGAMTWILPLTLSLIVTPMLYRSLGVETYGIYVLVLGLIAYSFNFGIGRAAVKYIAAYRSSNEAKKIRGIFTATLLLAFGLATVGMIVLVIIAPFLVNEILKIDPDSSQETVAAIRVGAIIIFFSTINQVQWSVIQGAHRFDVYSKLFNANSFLTLSGTLVLALLKTGLIPILCWNLLCLALTTIISVIAAKRVVPEIGVELAGLTTNLKKVTTFSSGIIAYQILGNSLLLFERGWITRTAGTESLAYYVIAMSLGLYLVAFSTSLTLTITPLASEIETDPKRLLVLYERATKFLGIIVTYLCVFLLLSRNIFLSTWIGPEAAIYAGGLLLIHVIAFSMHSLSIISWQMREGLGFPFHNFWIYLIASTINVTALIGLSDDLGTMGAAVGRLLNCVILFISIFQFEIWLFQKIQARFWVVTFGKIAIAATLACSTNYLLFTILPSGWVGIFVSFMGGGIIYLLVLWVLMILTVEERAMLLSFMGKRDNE